jgi:hypothetical protein
VKAGARVSHGKEEAAVWAHGQAFHSQTAPLIRLAPSISHYHFKRIPSSPASWIGQQSRARRGKSSERAAGVWKHVWSMLRRHEADRWLLKSSHAGGELPLACRVVPVASGLD